MVNANSKGRALLVLSVSLFLGLTLWFSSNVVSSQLVSIFNASSIDQAFLSVGVTGGFVAGCLVYAFLNVADIYDAKTVFVVSIMAGGLANGLAALGWSLGLVIGFRVLTGVFLAGVYPVGMKLVASWYLNDRGFALGVMVYRAVSEGRPQPRIWPKILLVGLWLIGVLVTFLIPMQTAANWVALLLFHNSYFVTQPVLALLIWRYRGIAIGSGVVSSSVTFIAAISYSLYIWHYPVLEWVHRYHFHVVIELLIYGLVSIALASLSYYFVESFWLSVKARGWGAAQRKRTPSLDPPKD